MLKDTPPSQAHIAPEKIVLIVDDEEDIGVALSELLTDEGGFRCVVATNSRQALDIINTMMPDLMLLDYQLPGMNGLELIDRVRYQRELAHVPAVLMSANLPPAPELYSRHMLGLAKPFDIDDVVTTVQCTLATAHPATTTHENVEQSTPSA
ncbi:MAG TPA: response regulator [Ktedonobacteraceae bacterium]|nr:response regulator [Ktedonobacteraceae bacterium]